MKAGTIKLKWEKPLETANVVVSFYRVMRSATSSYADAKQVDVVTRTAYVDVNPGAGANYYWVIPVHTAGDGVVSDVCSATARLIP